MSKKVLLAILPPFWPNMPPLGIGYLQAFLEKNDIKADLLDLNNVFYGLSSPELKKSWLLSCNSLLEEKLFYIMKRDFPSQFESCTKKILEYDIVGFSCFKSNIKTTVRMLGLLKSKKPDIKIMLGGPEITREFFKSRGSFDDKLKENSDYLVVGEGELSMLEYIKSEGPSAIRKFYELEKIEKLPFPRYQGLRLQDYPKKYSMPLLSSRGCIKKCAFCSERLLYKKFRSRNVQDIMKEIEFHKAENKTEYFIFHDSMINTDPEMLEKLCDSIIEKFGPIKWEAQLYIRKMDRALLEKMKKSGCYNLFIGLESGCDKTLRDMNKGFDGNAALSLFKDLARASLSFGVSMIVGYPGESEKDFQESLDFIIRNRNLIPKIEQVNPFTYYDGTDLPRESNYTLNKASLERLEIFTENIKKHGIKHTNAFIGNLIEK